MPASEIVVSKNTSNFFPSEIHVQTQNFQIPSKLQLHKIILFKLKPNIVQEFWCKREKT